MSVAIFVCGLTDKNKKEAIKIVYRILYFVMLMAEKKLINFTCL